MFDFSGMFSGIFSSIFHFLGSVFKTVFSSVFLIAFLFVTQFFIMYKLNPLKLKPHDLRALEVKWKYYDLFRWLLVDLLEHKKHVSEFGEYGFTFFVGRQGSGKTSSMVYYLNQMKKRYPDCVIVTNFSYEHSDRILKDWRDILDIRNGTDGVIFAIDEIHSEYSAASWKDVPESLLSEISQQRKQRVKIVATAQFFSRVAKPLREQAFSVVSCECWAKRLIKCREYDSLDYMAVIENPNAIRKKVRPIRKYSYVLSDHIRNCFDTYEKIERMKKIKFIPRAERGE